MADQTEKITENAAAEGVGRDEANGGGHKAALRAAAIAAATGATAFAAKRALSGRDQSESGTREKKPRSGPAEDSLVGSMLTSGWDAAKDSLLPFAEDAAGTAGEYVARNGPELLRDTLVPRFIRGFEDARAADDSDES